MGTDILISNRSQMTRITPELVPPIQAILSPYLELIPPDCFEILGGFGEVKRSGEWAAGVVMEWIAHFPTAAAVGFFNVEAFEI
ncbi:hypothetical protein AVEN_111597-1 [Araneus ventricosus]|uniref:Uncharacterized protein n=1 Tax=Araneus ventricosus TaxID=182803 RepID=A0A4Y2C3Y4_ARAVE|nr:hypothetical protein AVEN_111597-1 [Araneus ventricosus]